MWSVKQFASCCIFSFVHITKMTKSLVFDIQVTISPFALCLVKKKKCSHALTLSSSRIMFDCIVCIWYRSHFGLTGSHLNFQMRINIQVHVIFCDFFIFHDFNLSCVMGHEVLTTEMFTNLMTLAIFSLFVAFRLKPKQSVQSLSESCLGRVTALWNKVNMCYIMYAVIIALFCFFVTLNPHIIKRSFSFQ